MKTICTLCTVLLLLGCFNLPIGYYTVLRIIVTLSSGVILLQEVRKDVNLIGISFIGIAILFNPIFPFYLNNKSIWMSIDVLVAGNFLFYGFKKK